MPVDIAAPCVAHLLVEERREHTGTSSAGDTTGDQLKGVSSHDNSENVDSISSTDGYECPW